MGSNVVYQSWVCPTCGKRRPAVYIKCPADGTERPASAKVKR